jgi:hypothetical protein
VEVAAATKKHGLQPPWRRLAQYWRDIPIKAKGRVIQAGVGEAVGLGDAYRLHGTVRLPANATLEQRVALLEQQIQHVAVDVVNVDNRVQTEERARARAVQDESATRAQADEQLREAIKGLEIGSIDLTLFGLLWLFVGMVMTTGTPELCMLLHCAAGAGQ